MWRGKKNTDATYNNCQTPQSPAATSTSLNLSAFASVCEGKGGGRDMHTPCPSIGMCEGKKKSTCYVTVIASLHSRLVRFLWTQLCLPPRLCVCVCAGLICEFNSTPWILTCHVNFVCTCHVNDMCFTHVNVVCTCHSHVNDMLQCVHTATHCNTLQHTANMCTQTLLCNRLLIICT